MRTVELSDHPGDLLSAATEQRAAASQATHSARERRLKTLRKQRDAARDRRKWWTWLRLALAISRHKRSVPPSITAPTDTEEILRAGIEGEQRVAKELGRVLDDDWTLLHGYRNSRGEIDHLLIGPNGLFAIEVKNLNATVRITGDSWVADKYDRYGNHVDQHRIADRRGRSPSEQLNQPADALATFLHDRGQSVPVRRAVVLTHARSKLGEHTGLTVNVAVVPADIVRLVRDSPDRLDAKRRAAVQRLIEHDHAFHEKRRASRPPTRRR